jgi:hypothetical protein
MLTPILGFYFAIISQAVVHLSTERPFGLLREVILSYICCIVHIDEKFSIFNGSSQL